jgi:siderophore synthetase component
MNQQQVIEQTNAVIGSEWFRMLQSTHFTKVERRIVRQLIETLIYEDIVPCHSTILPLSSGEEQFVVPGKTADGQSVSYVCHGKRMISFGRVRLSKEPVKRVGPSGETAEAELSGFVVEVISQVRQDERLLMFMDELGQTLLKDTQAQYSNRLQELSGSERSYDELEGNIMDGHPYHPCYKSRIGFNLDDNVAYGPEFKPQFKSLWLAVSRTESKLSYSRSLDYAAFMKQELGEAILGRFTAALIASGKDPDDYWFVAVHPWQWREVIVKEFYRQMAEGRIIALGEGEDVYRPQQSIRTLANHSSRQKSYIKLPMNITNTSTGRILARHTILNAPLISDWLYGLLERDTYAERLGCVLLREVVGVSYDHDVLPGMVQSKAYGMLGAIWRESLHRYLRQGEDAAPFNALCHVNEIGRPFIDPWVHKHGIEAWTRTLLEAAVNPVIHMLFAHGVALESHAQNMILIHKDGMPVRLALKDFHDGVRFSRRHLADSAACPELYPVPAHHPKINRNSFIETDDASVVRDFVHDAFFFINIAELCMFLEEHYGLLESNFWGMVAQVIHGYRQEHPEHQRRFELFDLFVETIQVEQLTKRRLFGDTEFRMHEVPNPLHRFR